MKGMSSFGCKTTQCHSHPRPDCPPRHCHRCPSHRAHYDWTCGALALKGCCPRSNSHSFHSRHLCRWPWTPVSSSQAAGSVPLAALAGDSVAFPPSWPQWIPFQLFPVFNGHSRPLLNSCQFGVERMKDSSHHPFHIAEGPHHHHKQLISFISTLLG